MDEIKDLLAEWENDSFINPGAIKAAYDAVVLLVAKVEELEAQVQALSE